MKSTPSSDNSGHRHLLTQEIRIFLDFAEREARVANPHELAEIPPKPIIICMECRGRVETVLAQDIQDIRKRREQVIELLTANEDITNSEVLQIDEVIEKLDLRVGFLESEQVGWNLAAEEYLEGKKRILGENHDLSDSNVFLRRYHEAIKAKRRALLAPDPDFEIQVRSARFLATLIEGGPEVIGDEGFQRQHKNRDLEMAPAYGSEGDIRLAGKN